LVSLLVGAGGFVVLISGIGLVCFKHPDSIPVKQFIIQMNIMIADLMLLYTVKRMKKKHTMQDSFPIIYQCYVKASRFLLQTKPYTCLL